VPATVYNRLVVVKQFYLNCLAHASYLIGDEDSKAAVIVDPQRDTDQYLAFAKEHGLTIQHVVLTHFHADFVAGHLELRNRTGAAIYLGVAAKAEYPFIPLGERDSIDLGHVRLEALETPGHTAESISLVIYDLDRSVSEPQAVLTGDTLFVGDVGRPDLRVALGWSAADLGGLLYDSLRNKLLTLPDSSLVYPAHGAGSLCGKALSKETVSTIGEQKRSNYALQPMTREAFIDLVTADQPDAPPYFKYDAVLNSQERPTLDETLAREVSPVSLDQALALKEVGAQWLDTRDPSEFAAAHLAGSVNVGLGGQYATWAGTVLSRERPIVVIADPGREREAALRLGRIGFDHVVGYLDDGLRSVAERSDLTSTTDRVSPALAVELLASTQPPLTLDVRTPRERDQKHIKGSIGLPLSHLAERLQELPRDRPLLVHCAGGYRSSIAASILQSQGFQRVQELAGGIAAWEAAGLPLQKSDA